MRLISYSKRLLRKCINRAGFDLARFDQARFGHDVFVDIERLSSTWRCPITCFFDVGANDGETAKAALGRFPVAEVFSFEPHPATFAKLSKNVSDPRFHEFNIAFGERGGTENFFCYDDDKINSLVSNSTYAVRFAKKGEPISVNVVTIDEFCTKRQIGIIDVLKVDTEGFDLPVLMGASKKLAVGDIRFIYVEFNDVFEKSGSAGGGLLPICEFLYPIGFRLVTVYTDYLIPSDGIFGVYNALFALPPISAGAG